MNLDFPVRIELMQYLVMKAELPFASKVVAIS
jgi:hypothetical protein